MRYEEYVNIQLGKLKEGAIIREADMPDIDLYIDQVESFFEKQAGRTDSETAKKFLTKSMINNYAKHDMIPRPEGKKYSRDHMLMIAMVAYLKGTLRMEKIEYLMKPLVENYNSDFDESIDPSVIYEAACRFNQDYAQRMAEDTDSGISEIKRLFSREDDDDERMEVFTLILSLTMRADMDRYLAERLIEEYFINPENEKPEKVKKQKKQSI